MPLVVAAEELVLLRCGMRLRQKQQVSLLRNRLKHFNPRLCHWHDPHLEYLPQPISNDVERYTTVNVRAPRTVGIRPYQHARTHVRKVPLKQINVHKTFLRIGTDCQVIGSRESNQSSRTVREDASPGRWQGFVLSIVSSVLGKDVSERSGRRGSRTHMTTVKGRTV